MRKVIGSALAVLGAFFIVIALMATFYAPDRLMKTPLDVDTTTRLEGIAQLSNGTRLVSTPVKATSITYVDSEKSTDDIAVFVTSSCLVKDVNGIEECVSADDPQNRLISASTDHFTSHRKTAMAENVPSLLPADAVAHEGLVNKWPFDSEKKTYPYWDGMVGSAVDAVFDREEEVDGVELYVYKVDVEGAEIEIAEGVPGTYDDQKEIWVEPITGSVVNQIDHQERRMADGKHALILDLAFTDEQVQTSVAEAADKADKLDLIRSTVPIIGFAAGIPMLLVGLVLLYLGHRDREVEEPEVRQPVASGV